MIHIFVLLSAVFLMSTNVEGDNSEREVGSKSTVLAGVVFTRWGHNECPLDTKLVYTGVMGSKYFSQVGNGGNYLCLPVVPDYDEAEVVSGVQTDRAYIYHTEYLGSTGPFSDMRYHDGICAVCLDDYHNNVILYPSRRDCPAGWDVEYYGFLMAARTDYQTTEHICVDVEGRAMLGTGASVAGGRMYPVEARCPTGSGIPCGPYVDGYELTCAMCAI
ncbi:uncharacterized protein LOC144434405 [Glandiceps talaboti]